jgi:hypothetical protein
MRTETNEPGGRASAKRGVRSRSSSRSRSCGTGREVGLDTWGLQIIHGHACASEEHAGNAARIAIQRIRVTAAALKREGIGEVIDGHLKVGSVR